MTGTIKYKINSLLWGVLFSWIIIVGSSPTYTGNCDTGFSLCYPTMIMGLEIDSSIPRCTYNFQKSTAFSDVACDRDYCCKDKECNSEEKFLFSIQNPNFQKQFVNCIITHPKPLTKGRVVNLIFDYHKTLQTNSIYIITQSFLC